MIAAFLTLIGFSVNDTIVIFDRIRELKGKTPQLTGKMINDAVNQTLSRTILTSLTAWLVVVILYILGGEGLHGFAFSLVVGFLSGTYSTIYIASPILIDWDRSARCPLEGRARLSDIEQSTRSQSPASRLTAERTDPKRASPQSRRSQTKPISSPQSGQVGQLAIWRLSGIFDNVPDIGFASQASGSRENPARQCEDRRLATVAADPAGRHPGVDPLGRSAGLNCSPPTCTVIVEPSNVSSRFQVATSSGSPPASARASARTAPGSPPASRGSQLPVTALSRLAAIAATSSGASSSRVATFTPTPTISRGPSSLATPSTRIPPSFRPSISTSFGHRIPARHPGTRSSIAATITAATPSATRGRTATASPNASGSSTTDAVRLPPSDHHEFAPCPRPRVCRSAQTKAGRSVSDPLIDQPPRPVVGRIDLRRGAIPTGRTAMTRANSSATIPWFHPPATDLAALPVRSDDGPT